MHKSIRHQTQLGMLAEADVVAKYGAAQRLCSIADESMRVL